LDCNCCRESSSIGGANIPNTIPEKLEETDIKLYMQINELITTPLRDECTQEMYRDNGRGFTDKQKNDYMKACISSYEQLQMKERLIKKK
jgi:hypothetical protein